MKAATLQSPLGPLSLTEDAGLITALHWHTLDGTPTPLLQEAISQLQAYFERRLTRFDLPLAWGTGLHEKVRRAMAAIPFGETRTYGDLSRQIGAPPRP